MEQIEKAIEELKIKKTITDYKLSEETIELAIQALREKKESVNLHRVPVEEQPVATNEEIEYLLCVNGKKGNSTYEHAVIAEGMVEDGRWYIDGIIDHDLEIIAWMPYPDGYWKEQE